MQVWPCSISARSPVAVPDASKGNQLHWEYLRGPSLQTLSRCIARTAKGETQKDFCLWESKEVWATTRREGALGLAVPRRSPLFLNLLPSVFLPLAEAVGAWDGVAEHREQHGQSPSPRGQGRTAIRGVIQTFPALNPR